MFKPYIGLQEIAPGGVWYQQQNPNPTQVSGYALEVTSGVYEGSIYPIESIRYTPQCVAEVKCRSTKMSNGNYRSKTFNITEYSTQSYELITYTGEPVITKTDINFYDMFKNKIKKDDWMFTEYGLCQVTKISKTGITFDHQSYENRRDWSMYAVVNDNLLTNVNGLIFAKSI